MRLRPLNIWILCNYFCIICSANYLCSLYSVYAVCNLVGPSESNKFSINSNRLNEAHTSMKSSQIAPSVWHPLTLLPLLSLSIWKLSHVAHTYLMFFLYGASALRLLHFKCNTFLLKLKVFYFQHSVCRALKI